MSRLFTSSFIKPYYTSLVFVFVESPTSLAEGVGVETYIAAF